MGFDRSNAMAGGGGEHLPDPLPADPMPLFRAWWDEAHAKQVQPNPNAMTLATVDADGRVSARIVLCKAFNTVEGVFVFYTNYTGRKAVAIEDGASGPLGKGRVALVFHWDNLDRQVRVEGVAVRSPAEESDAYFATRPWQSRIGAWASDQSRPIESPGAMLTKLAETMKRFGLDPFNPPREGASVSIPRPPHWGGYRVWADRIELWAAGAGRLHDRAVWSRALVREGASLRAGAWSATRLQP